MAPLTEQQPVLDSAALHERYCEVRSFSEVLCETLAPEDCCLQSMADASPVRWHLAHTSWFFETFVLKRDPQYLPYDQQFEVLFNSYYNSVGEQFPRPQRGLLSRPTVAEIFAYRQHVDRQMEQFARSGFLDSEIAAIIELGIQHEQQHQELILTDLKHLFSFNPLMPTYRDGSHEPLTEVPAQHWFEHEEGIYEVGYEGGGFCYDNEGPRHRVLLEPFAIAERPVTSGEYLEFMEDDGYQLPELWLSLGWHFVQELSGRQPLYWFQRDGRWHEYTLAGPRPLDLTAPVCHVSYFEADAFARWAGARLPKEAEWEVSAEALPQAGNFADCLLEADRALHPASSGVQSAQPVGMFGNCWEWTASPYTPYPGYRAATGALGEYNGKFMCNQYVLRGGSVATSSDHIRSTYRNFFAPDARWQFSGIRLAK